MEWNDPDLAWNTSIYSSDQVVLPADTIWTPSLTVINAVSLTQKHGSKDVLVYSNGTVEHSLILKTVVSCEVNMFKYPFVRDACPIPINGWNVHGCGLSLVFGQVESINGDSGDWVTEDVKLIKGDDRPDRNYLFVYVSIRYFGPVVTLLLPSALIIIADVASFALPIGGGERISFKVTLVLSFIMFLLILNDLLPGEGQCNPILRIHFCMSLVLLVLSMLTSMLFTRVAKDGGIFLSILIKCCKSKDSASDDKDDQDKLGDDETTSDDNVSVIKVNAPEEENGSLQKVVHFIERLDAQEKKNKRCERLANKLDKAYFWFYLILCMVYTAALVYLFVSYKCDVDHLGFWNK